MYSMIFFTYSNFVHNDDHVNDVTDHSCDIPLESSRNEEFVVFPPNRAPSAVRKDIGDLRNSTRIMIFCYKRGCDSTTVKLVLLHIGISRVRSTFS